MKKVFIYSTVLFGSFLLIGCGSEESTTKRVGNKLGETMTELTQGIGEGIDNQMLVEVTFSEEMESKGYTKTVAKSFGVGSSDKGYSVYVIANEPDSSTLISKAFDDAGLEIGRAILDVNFKEDEAKYLNFIFNSEMDAQLVNLYTVEIK